MATQRDYNRLAKLKKEKKEKEEAIKDLEQRILQNNPKKEVQTSYGMLKLNERKNPKIRDNWELLQNSSITEQMLINTAKISKSDVEKIVGKQELQQLFDLGTIFQDDPTRYYCLNK